MDAPRPPRAYRHWASEFAAVAKRLGCIRLSLAAYYEDIDQARLQDAYEGKVVGSTSRTDFSGLPPNHPHMVALAAHGILIDSPANTVRIVEGNRFESVTEPFYVFCMSLDNRREKFDGDNDRKDAVSLVENVAALSDALTLAAAGSPFISGPSAWGLVSYEDRDYDILARHLEPSPFIKRKLFEPDQEVRIILPATDDAPRHIFVSSPQIREVFSGWNA